MADPSDPPPSPAGSGTAPPPFGLEEVEDAYLDGDRAFEAGTARAAFSHRTFRTVYLGAFASNIGTWMQNVVLSALAWHLTKSALFVGAMNMAQLGPLFLFSPIGGVIADTYPRKRSLLILSTQQALFSLLLALVVVPEDPSRVAMLAVVTMIGIGNALYAPIFSSVVPILVPRRDLSGAISLNSVQMNASRVIGPIIGTQIYARWGAPWVFVANAFSFGFVILSVLLVTLPTPVPSASRGLQRLLEGVQTARADRVVGQCLVVIFTFSFFCLPFIPQMATIAGEHLDMDTTTGAFGWLYACFGIGAVIGALSIGTVFAGSSKPLLTRAGLLGFAVMVLAFGTLRAAAPAYLAITVLGCVYFAVITSLSTVLQQDLDDSVRGKVMALWIMGFGGIVPFGGLAGGVIIEVAGITPMIVLGTIVAVALAWWADLLPVRPRGRFGIPPPDVAAGSELRP